jgi:thioesterase domain-containing protein/acyl carrier protein
VKIRGFRVELGEIEIILNKHPGVAHAVVATFDRQSAKELVAYVRPRPGHPAGAGDLRDFLGKRLPQYMVPSAFVEMEEFPLTPNGKIDRLRLPAPGEAGGRQTESLPDPDTAPRDKIEKRLTEIWEKHLERKIHSVDDNYFDLGGHSLLAVQIFNDLHTEYNLRLPLALLIEFPTIRAFAASVRKMLGLPGVVDAPAAVPPGKIAREPFRGETGPTETGNDADETLAKESSSEKQAWNTVVPINTQGDFPPFFCVAGLGGNPLSLRPLAVALGKRQPFYALQFRGVDGVNKPHESVEDTAKEFLADIRRIQPDGPYFLGGYSFGGLVAYEIARQILKLGKKMGGLVLLDSYNPAFLKWSFTGRIRAHLELARSMGPIGYFKNWLHRRRRYYELRLKSFAAKRDPFTYRLERVHIANWQTGSRYVPAPLDAQVVLIKSGIRNLSGGIGRPPHESNGWRSLLPGNKFEVRTLHCMHLDFETEQFANLAAPEITESLAIFRAKSGNDDL